MAITNFIPSVWESALLTEFRGVSVVDIITTKPTRVEGGKAIFNRVSGGEIKDYNGTVTYDDITTTPVELVYDKKKVVALKIDDVDAVQAAGDVLQTLVADKALQMAEVQNGIVFKEALNKAHASNKIGSTSAKKQITQPFQAYDAVVALGVKLSKHKVPKTNRFLIASDEFVQLMARDDRFVDNFNVLPNGVVDGGTIAGFTVIVNEDLPEGTALALHKSALGYGMELDKTEALRLEGSFSDAVRTLQVSGVTALRDEAIAAFYYEIDPTVANGGFN